MKKENEMAVRVMDDEQRVAVQEHVREYQRYYDDEDPGYLYADDDEDNDEGEGCPEYIVKEPEGTQAYYDYAKAVEGFNLYCDYYEREGWRTVCRRQARNAAVIDGVEVRAMCAVYARGFESKRIELNVRMECN